MTKNSFVAEVTLNDRFDVRGFLFFLVNQIIHKFQEFHKFWRKGIIFEPKQNTISGKAIKV